MNQRDKMKSRLKIMTLFMAFLFMWGAVGQLFVHVCCEHCHEGFFCEETISTMQHSNDDCCDCISLDDHSSDLSHNNTTHHCDCADKHLLDTEESKIESILPQLHSHELLLFVCELSRVIPAFIANTQPHILYSHSDSSPLLDGRSVLLQSQILII